MPGPSHDHHAPESDRARVAPGATAPFDDEILTGTPYKVLGKLAAGGMGIIFEAEHRELGKRVVVKVLHPKYADDPRIVHRLKREARILAGIASPHLVAVSDLGQTPRGWTYVAMERLRGRTLGAELKARGSLPLLEAIHWTREVLAGLAAAHRAGVVHRDVKLDNVFLCDAADGQDRRIKLLDFGIARLLNGAAAGMDRSLHEPTAEGTLLGSPRWLAPEQARGTAVDARADIYAVGLLIYTLIAGRGPFSHAAGAIEAIEASLGEVPAPPSRHASQPVPPDLDEAILMALAKAPEDRFQNAEAFSTALESIASAIEDTTQPLPTRLASSRVDSGVVRPTAGEERADTTPTVTVAPRVAWLPPWIDRGPTRGDARDRAPPIGAAGSAGVSVRAFLALTAVTTLAFTVVLGLIVQLAGGR